ncbi:ras-related protein Rap-1b-like [Parasteatoda tepidariorum]|uniref:ras-related protein Rap-1b-like n=1 Tax=Parasteatoda tepidariorum TaxID=114398 RepID=UPI00077F9C44|nr:ras-related protein Rap-1b-like [Parasteatoda tepidariorum]XP_042898661.1 ras-related protein Rap-1b-like [Parasteatoda tepidariorum]
MKENRLVVLGAGGVGKTSLVVQYLEGFFTTTYKPTIEDYYRHAIRMPDGVFHSVEILDTAGSLNFPAMRELCIKSGRGFILVFSVDDVQSFHEAMEIWEIIVKLRGTRVPVIVVGNKTDLVEKRKVTQEMVTDALKERSAVYKYLETSAKMNINVAELFVELLEYARQLENPSPEPQPSRRLSRRLSSFGNINLTIRRKSSVPKVNEVKKEKVKAEPKCIIS